MVPLLAGLILGIDVKALWSVLVLVAPCLGACQLPTNVALKRIDELRAAQDACLKGNVAQFEDRTSEPRQIGRFVAMSCSVQTDKLVQYAVPYATRKERDGFETDAIQRAAGYVVIGRGTAS